MNNKILIFITAMILLVSVVMAETNNPVACYEAENNYLDTSGNGLTLTAGATANFSTSNPFMGTASFNFDGAIGDVVMTPFHNETNWCVSLWAYTDTIENSQIGFISTADVGDKVGIIGRQDALSDDSIDTGLCVAGSCTNHDYGDIPENQWFHYIASYDGSYFVGYLNGSMKINVSKASLIHEHNWHLGDDYVNYTSRWYKGQVDMVVFYDHKCSQDDAQDLYNSYAGLNPCDVSTTPDYSIIDLIFRNSTNEITSDFDSKEEFSTI